MKESFSYAVVSLCGYDEPVLVEDLLNLYPSISRQAVYKKIDAALEEGEIIRFERGVYYVPRKDYAVENEGQSIAEADDESGLPFPKRVVRRRWVEDYGGNVFGHIAGASLMYECGLLDEEPSVLEVTTNKESSRVREVPSCGPWKKILLRRSRLEITRENAKIQRFLDLITHVQLEKASEESLEIVAGLAQGFDRDIAYECLEHYPGKTAKRLAFCERRKIFS